MSISKLEFKELLSLEKIFKENNELVLGPSPLDWTRDIISVDRREFFLLDFYRDSFEIKKYTYNNRYKQSIILVRLDSMGRHTNPDGKIIESPHVHIKKVLMISLPIQSPKLV